MKRKSKGKRKRNDVFTEETEYDVPQSFIIHHGIAGPNVKNLISDFKKVMRPNTAQKLITRKKNTLMDFVKMSGLLKVSHMIIFSQTKLNLYMKLARLPQGPTLTFRIKDYSLSKDVLSNQGKQLVDAKRFLYAPCLMTNLQPSEGEPHLQLSSKIFLDMFPTISPSQVKTKEIKRCCLFHYNEDDEIFDFRHYAIQTLPMGIANSTSKLIDNKVPDLGSFKDVSDFFKSEILSESEVEDNPSAPSINSVIKKKEKVVNHQSKVKLFEIGPRLSLELIKVEDGMCNGTVLYHKYISKTDEEKLEIQKQRERKRLLKKKRNEEQEKNVKKKDLRKEEHRQRCLKGMGIDAESSKRKSDSQEILKDTDDDDDDYAYFKEEVGEEPEKDLFKKKQKEKSQYKRFSKKKKI